MEFPALKVVMEHITTEEAADFVSADTSGRLAATVTPQHLIFSRNALFTGGIRPHHYCLPVLKRERHRLALRRAATSGDPRFFLGTDSAPHQRVLKESSCGCAGIFNAPGALQSYLMVFDEEGALDRFEAFASVNGARFYGLRLNEGRITLQRHPSEVPEDIFLPGGGAIHPFLVGPSFPGRSSSRVPRAPEALVHQRNARHKASRFPMQHAQTSSMVSFSIQPLENEMDAANQTFKSSIDYSALGDRLRATGSAPRCWRRMWPSNSASLARSCIDSKRARSSRSKPWSAWPTCLTHRWRRCWASRSSTTRRRWGCSNACANWKSRRTASSRTSSRSRCC